MIKISDPPLTKWDPEVHRDDREVDQLGGDPHHPQGLKVHPPEGCRTQIFHANDTSTSILVMSAIILLKSYFCSHVFVTPLQ